METGDKCQLNFWEKSPFNKWMSFFTNERIHCRRKYQPCFSAQHEKSRSKVKFVVNLGARSMRWKCTLLFNILCTASRGTNVFSQKWHLPPFYTNPSINCVSLKCSYSLHFVAKCFIIALICHSRPPPPTPNKNNSDRYSTNTMSSFRFSRPQEL